MNDKEIIASATQLLGDTRAGLLTTIDLNGAPNVRWMATHTLLGSLDVMYTITSPTSNKAAEIAANPNVTWLFSRVNFTEIAKIRGKAFIEDDPLLKSQIWDAIGSRTWRYFTINKEDPTFAVLVTEFREIEYYAPGKQMFEPVRVTLAKGA